jgi:hypothetical protein
MEDEMNSYLMTEEAFIELMHIRGALRVGGNEEISKRIDALTLKGPSGEPPSIVKAFDTDQAFGDWEDCSSCHALYRPKEWWDNIPGYDPEKCEECQEPGEPDYDSVTLDEQIERARRDK